MLVVLSENRLAAVNSFKLLLQWEEAKQKGQLAPARTCVTWHWLLVQDVSKRIKNMTRRAQFEKAMMQVCTYAWQTWVVLTALGFTVCEPFCAGTQLVEICICHQTALPAFVQDGPMTSPASLLPIRCTCPCMSCVQIYLNAQMYNSRGQHGSDQVLKVSEDYKVWPASHACNKSLIACATSA